MPVLVSAHCANLPAHMSLARPFLKASNSNWCGSLSDLQQRPCQWTIPLDLANSWRYQYALTLNTGPITFLNTLRWADKKCRPKVEFLTIIILLMDVSSTQDTLLEDHLLLSNRFNIHHCSDYCMTSQRSKPNKQVCRMEFPKTLRDAPEIVKDRNKAMRLEMPRDHPYQKKVDTNKKKLSYPPKWSPFVFGLRVLILNTMLAFDQKITINVSDNRYGLGIKGYVQIYLKYVS